MHRVIENVEGKLDPRAAHVHQRQSFRKRSDVRRKGRKGARAPREKKKKKKKKKKEEKEGGGGEGEEK